MSPPPGLRARVRRSVGRWGQGRMMSPPLPPLSPGVLVLRRRSPDLPRPFRVPYATFVCIAGAWSLRVWPNPFPPTISPPHTHTNRRCVIGGPDGKPAVGDVAAAGWCAERHMGRTRRMPPALSLPTTHPYCPPVWMALGLLVYWFYSRHHSATKVRLCLHGGERGRGATDALPTGTCMGMAAMS